MTISLKSLALAGAAVLVVGAAGIAYAQSAGAVSAALSSGEVGEQADGYLGFRSTPSGELRDEVDAINIKRRDAYTKLATQRGVTVRDVAVTVGCETLQKRVAIGRSYLLTDGIWRTKDEDPIALPDYCVQ
jgi:uncharacterized protein YdbL (DUF1318 family)